MSKFIKVTELRKVKTDCDHQVTYRETRVPRLINVDTIESVENGVVHFAIYRIKVAETLEQIEEQLKDNEDD